MAVADELAKFVLPVDGEGEGVPPEATRKATTTKAVIAIAAPAGFADLGVFPATG